MDPRELLLEREGFVPSGSPPDLLYSQVQPASQKSSQSRAVGVSNLRCNFIHTGIAGLQQVHRALHA
jgi:hypothetical protein